MFSNIPSTLVLIKEFKLAWNNENAKGDVFCFFNEKILMLSKEGKFSTAGIYSNSLNAL